MRRFLLRRLLLAPIPIVGICVIIFALIHALPGDPIAYYRAQLGPAAVDREALEAIRQRHGLDAPLPQRFALWSSSIARGDLGRSFIDQREVREKIVERLPNTLLLNGLALLLSIVIGVPLGALLASRRSLAAAGDLLLLLLFSIPTFWIALLLIDFFAIRLHLLPAVGISSSFEGGGWFSDRARHLILPVVTLSIVNIALLARFTKTSVEEVMNEDFIRAARARGAGEGRVFLVHALRNASIPIISLVGVLLPLILSGSVIVERIFQWHGIGELFFEAALARDYPVVMGLTLISAIFVLLTNVLVDVSYAAADPRIAIMRDGS